MPTTSSTFHIPFPRAFLAVNTPIQKVGAPVVLAASIADESAHGFLSNQPFVPRHKSVSSVSSIGSATSQSDAGTFSAPSSPPTKAADSPVLGPKVFAPLAVNTKHTLPPQSVKEMSAAEKSAFLSNKR